MNGRPVFAAPEGPRALRLAGLARFQPFTARRTAYRRLMHLAILLGVDRLISTSVSSPLDPARGFDFEHWLERVREQLNEPQPAAVVFWPPQVNRGRIYVHLFDARQQPIGFAKVSFDAANDARLAREADILAHLTARKLRHCQVPAVRARGQACGHEYVVLEPLPSDARPIDLGATAYPRDCVEEFAGPVRRLPGQALERLSWWPAFLSSIDNSAAAFLAELRSVCADGIRVRRGHGDFGQANIVISNGRIWVYDWEESCDDAPAAIDEVSFDLGLNFRFQRSDPEGSRRRFQERYLKDADQNRRADVMLALAFRQSIGMMDSQGLIRHWKHARPTT